MSFRPFGALIASIITMAMPAHLLAGPVQIESGKMIVFHKTNRVIFTGNVHLKRDDFVLLCDKLVAYYSESNLEKAEATGNIKLTHGKVKGTADKVLLNQGQDTLTLSGNAFLEQDGSRVEGERIVHHMKKEETMVYPSSGGRTHMVIESDRTETGSSLLPGGNDKQ